GEIDFFALKGAIEAVVAELKAGELEYKANKELPFMHPGRTADVFLAGKKIGFMGQIHPTVAESFECPRESCVAVLDLKPLCDAAVEIPKSKELPKFPGITRDIAVVVPKSVSQGEVAAIIRQRGGKLLESCELFDCYEGIQLGLDKKSLAYSLMFRNPDCTLKDEDVEKPMKKILNGLESIGAELR
ncbi:MAG: phenylalanine--tRNA ligase subunit beta, partial [Clostridia bacterium]|nr:phenylalanine--tRNA ligase subunit beta [Clostridia bacterium]